MGARTTRSKQGNLPAELTSFVGRRRELAEVKTHLASTRLLTLTGSGGAGKTRLAIRAAAEMARNFKDGACMAALAPIDDPLLVTQAVFSALGLPDVSSRWSMSALIDYLRDRRMLLVLDNCEHLLDSVAVLAGTLLKACPELRILATSRQPLGMAAEVRLRVPSLALPDPGQDLTSGQLAGFDAVALLVERARAVQPNFDVNESNARSVLELCARLDGLPLALELAAVRLEGLSVQQLLADLDRELVAPASALRGGEARQRTLEATLDWSHSLLSAEQRRAWARLSVFAGSFDEKGAATVCSDDDGFSHVLAGLVESSILQRDVQVNPPRYAMLETVRQYGRRKLHELGEELQVQTRHRDWVKRLVTEATSSPGDDDPEGFDRVHRERDNVWSALDFCLRQPGQADAGVMIVAFLNNYWLCRGPLRDVRRYLEAMLALTEPNTMVRARCLDSLAMFADVLDDPVAAEQAGKQALEMTTALGDEMWAGWACGSLLFAAFIQGKHAGVDALAQRMHDAGVKTRNPQLVAMSQHYRCLNWLGEGKLDEIVAVGEEALEALRKVGNRYHRGTLANTVAEARRRRGELDAAEVLIREGIECKQPVDDRRGLATLIETLAWITADRHDYSRAATLLGCAHSLRHGIAIPIVGPFVPQHEECEARTRDRLGESPFAKAFALGLAMPVTEATQYALRKAAPKAVAAPIAKASTALSKREMEIARLIAEGLTNREVATRLFISSRTVETHVTNMMNKLGLKSRTQLARWVG